VTLAWKEGDHLNIYIHQNITIQQLKLGNLTNSSVFQIGSAGSIKAQSLTKNTGGFTQPAPPVIEPGQQVITSETSED